MHITNDSMVPVLRNKVLKFRFYMYLKEGLYMQTIQAQYLINFLRLNFLRWRLNCRISQKIAPRRKVQLYGIHEYFILNWLSWKEKKKHEFFMYFNFTLWVYEPTFCICFYRFSSCRPKSDVWFFEPTFNVYFYSLSLWANI